MVKNNLLAFFVHLISEAFYFQIYSFENKQFDLFFTEELEKVKFEGQIRF